jgi:hypothetical protein
MVNARSPDEAPPGSWRHRIQQRIPWMREAPRRMERKTRADGGIAGIAYGAAGWIGWASDAHPTHQTRTQ